MWQANSWWWHWWIDKWSRCLRIGGWMSQRCGRYSSKSQRLIRLNWQIFAYCHPKVLHSNQGWIRSFAVSSPWLCSFQPHNSESQTCGFMSGMARYGWVFSGDLAFLELLVISSVGFFAGPGYSYQLSSFLGANELILGALFIPKFLNHYTSVPGYVQNLEIDVSMFTSRIQWLPASSWRQKMTSVQLVLLRSTCFWNFLLKKRIMNNHEYKLTIRLQFVKIREATVGVVDHGLFTGGNVVLVFVVDSILANTLW